MSTWHKACPWEELRTHKLCRRSIDGLDLLIVLSEDGQIFALENRCSHADKRLDQGSWNAQDGLITCPFHKSVFDLKNGGRPQNPPAVTPLFLYSTRKVSIENSVWVEVDLDSSYTISRC